MRVKVPEAIVKISTRRIYDPITKSGPSDPTRQHTYDAVLGFPLDYVDAEDGTYFYETHGREINDCVHSKPISNGEVGTPHAKVVGEDSVYNTHHYSCETIMWDEFPFKPFPPNSMSGRIRYVPNVLVVNDGRLSYICKVDLAGWQNGGLNWIRYNLTLYYYKGTNKTSHQYYYREIQLMYQYQFTQVCYDGYDDKGYAKSSRFLTTGDWTGKFTCAYNTDWLTEEEKNRLGVLPSGLTGTHYYGLRYYFLTPIQSLLDAIVDQVPKIYRDGLDSNFRYWSLYSTSNTRLIGSLDVPPIRERFLLHEDELIAERIDPYLITRKGLPNYWKNVLVQNAYLDTLDHVPRLNDNSISNIIELVGFIKSLVIDHEIDIPSSLQDAWLAYRYSYQTTKLDTEEAISFVHRYADLGSLNNALKCYGESRVTYSFNSSDILMTCRCCASVKPRDVAYLDQIWRALYTYGLQPNFYVVWDMIPYSFIIDWFIPVGELAHVADARNQFGSFYDISDVCFSISYDVVTELGTRYHQYSRWRQDEVPQLNGFYFFEEDPVSTKVVGMRALDALSLFIGKG